MSAVPRKLLEPRLILASASPRRQSLLREAGFEFVVHPSGLDEESAGRGVPPAEMAAHLAEAKARDVADLFPNDLILAADTVVDVGGKILGKPDDAEHARQMLTLLAGTTHQVVTGVTVLRRSIGFVRRARVASTVSIRKLNESEIARYVAGGDWQGKAGGYGIQDNDSFVTRMSGCQTNIVGLPMTTTAALLAEAGILPKFAG